MFSQILCATDLSPRSDEALRVAVKDIKVEQLPGLVAGGLVRLEPCPVMVIPYASK